MRRSLHDRIGRLEIAASAVTPLSEMTDEELDARIRRLALALNLEPETAEMDLTGEDNHERN